MMSVRCEVGLFSLEQHRQCLGCGGDTSRDEDLRIMGFNFDTLFFLVVFLTIM